ncbi:MAG: hypothetical protein HWE34_13565 [Methylocystaceae bacterium]|nr:hypothetical protein [Methylocystaceae bacterium]
MTTRTSLTTVTFKDSFVIDPFKETHPAGTYKVEIDEELIPGLSFQAYKRNLTIIYIPVQGKPDVLRALTVDAKELERALKRDEIGEKYNSPREKEA